MDDDDFDDDELDGIAGDTLLDLETKAISSTQRPQSNHGRPEQSNRIHTYGAPGQSRNTTKSAWRPPQPRQQPQSRPQPAPQAASIPQPPSSDYGFDDEDVIDLDEPSMVIQPPASLPTRQRTAPPAARYGSKPPLDPETEAAFAAADAELGAVQPGQWVQAPHLQPRANDGIDVSSLQARIAELEAEQNRLKKAEQTARQAAQAKAGEISIVRSNADKASKEYDRRIAVMQKLHADENTKAKAELEAGKKEREKMQTDNRFLQHDLAQEAAKAKRTQSNGAHVNGVSKSFPGARKDVTPKKVKKTSMGDGFDDDEVQLLASPSRSREKDKSRDGTPKQGAKRKRVAQDSPLPAPTTLSFSNPAPSVSREHSKDEVRSVKVKGKQDDRYDFMQRLLRHIPFEGHDRSIEALTKLYFPSDKTKSLSSLLMDGVSSPLRHVDDPLCLKLSRTCLDLWSRCLEETYYEPVYLLLDLVRFAMRLELAATISQLIQQAVPICIRTMDLIASPTLLLLTNKQAVSDKEKTAIAADGETGKYIDVDEILDFVKVLSDASTLDSESLEQFWRHVGYQFLLVMLNRAQPMSQIMITLDMLGTSCMNTTFGPIYQPKEGEDVPPDRQAVLERNMIDRLTVMLFAMPEVPADEPAYTSDEIAEFRIAVLEVLQQLILTDHGSLLLAQNGNAIGRLVRFLESQINKLYSTRPSLGLQSDTPTTHDLIVRTINTTIRIVYYVLQAHSDIISIQQKMLAVRGGWHKFLVSMTRIAFSDQLVLEHGIEDAAVEAAHEILDSVLSPEEGEAIMKAVETPAGTRSAMRTGDTTEVNTESQQSGGSGMEEDEPG